MRGPTRLPLPGNQLRLRIGNMPPWRLPTRLDNAAFFFEVEDTHASSSQKFWVGFLSWVRLLSCVTSMRAVVSSVADFSHELPGHNRFEINVERQLDTIMRTPRN